MPGSQGRGELELTGERQAAHSLATVTGPGQGSYKEPLCRQTTGLPRPLWSPWHGRLSTDTEPQSLGGAGSGHSQPASVSLLSNTSCPDGGLVTPQGSSLGWKTL